MGRGSNLDPEFDEFNTWARWVAETHEPTYVDDEWSGDGGARRES